ncbi:MAG: hypothetical protein QXS54_09235, partial [Candidatus Methanomethylicaceae archaeon]
QGNLARTQHSDDGRHKAHPRPQRRPNRRDHPKDPRTTKHTIKPPHTAYPKGNSTQRHQAHNNQPQHHTTREARQHKEKRGFKQAIRKGGVHIKG